MDKPEPQLGVPKTSRRTRWAPILLTGAVVIIYYVATRPGPPLEGWSNDLDAAIAQAGATNRKILVAFHTDGCPPCIMMERTVLNTARVRKALGGYIPLMVDPFRAPRTAIKYRAHATPTYVILDGSGKLLARTEGYHSVREFVKFLEQPG